MVSQQTKNLDRVFHALSDPTRRAMLKSLRGGERKIRDLAAPHDMSFAAASKHVRVLERAGLVRRRIDGRAHFCRIVPEPLKDATGWLEAYRHYWDASFDRLGAYLTQLQKERGHGGAGQD